MTVRDVLGFTMIVSGSLMTLAYSVLLTHVIRGNKNKWLMIVVSILLVS
jgi:hypothetical protein